MKVMKIVSSLKICYCLGIFKRPNQNSAYKMKINDVPLLFNNCKTNILTALIFITNLLWMCQSYFRFI